MGPGNFVHAQRQQAMASLAYLHPQIEAIHLKAEELDVPTPVIDALRDALQGMWITLLF